MDTDLSIDIPTDFCRLTGSIGFLIANVVLLRSFDDDEERIQLLVEQEAVDAPSRILVSSDKGRLGHIERPTADVLEVLIKSNIIIADAIILKSSTSNAELRPVKIQIYSRFDDPTSIKNYICNAGLSLNTDTDPGSPLLNYIFEDVSEKNQVLIVPVEPPKDIILTELLQHQKEALGWLVSRENSCDLPPFWEEEDGFFKCVLNGECTIERPKPWRGGIYADSMGLGKTLTMLSLMVTNRPSDSAGPKATLVVCPVPVQDSWVAQLKEHIKEGVLDVHVYYGGSRIRDIEQLKSYDIVLTTYSTLAKEHNSDSCPLEGIEWLRVVLDSAHAIKNDKTKKAKAAIALKAERRWVVTTTPILDSHIAFLGFQPFSEKKVWERYLQSKQQINGMMRLQSLERIFLLQRTTDQVSIALPQKTVEICFVDFSTEELANYNYTKTIIQNVLEQYLDRGNFSKELPIILHILLPLRQICDDRALCPQDIESLMPIFALKDVSNNEELFMRYLDKIEDGDDLNCPICLSGYTKAVISYCAHMFCKACILEALERSGDKCPMCREPLSREKLFVVPLHPSNDDANFDRPCSSKVRKLLELLQVDKAVKSVVISQFRMMLILLEKPLKAAGFRILHLDAMLSLVKRGQVIEDFEKCDPATPTVLLATFKAINEGINLTAASRLYLLDPLWNPLVEEQASNRIYRIGQKKDVRIVRLIMKDSIEERMIELQEQNKDTGSNPFGSTSSRSLSKPKLSLRDIRSLVNM